MELTLDWLAPLPMRDGDNDGLIYRIDDLDDIPDQAGIYIFYRVFGKNYNPLYIGKSLNIKSRVKGQLNNLRLMKGIYGSGNGGKFLSVGVFKAKKGQNKEKCIDIMERALIRAAYADGYHILNKQGKAQKTHEIVMNGSKQHRGPFLKRFGVAASP